LSGPFSISVPDGGKGPETKNSRRGRFSPKALSSMYERLPGLVKIGRSNPASRRLRITMPNGTPLL
jgi:hypothetical protein